MGEPSACLVRSFSSPADTRYEGNPVHALGESISFGRFMTENLDWEKWSTFTHNRYVEEAERYSKPGSVAAKKAYFEAHYKRKAAERAAALVQEANANPQANGTLELEAQQRNYADSSSETSSNVQNVVAANEQPDEETFNYQVVECADGDQRECDAGQSDHALVNTNINLGNFTSIDNSNQFDHVEGNTNTGPVEEKMLDHGTAGPNVSTKKRQANSSPELSTKTVSSKCFPLDEKKAGAAAVSSRSGINSGPKGKKSVGDLVEKNKLTAQSVHSSINLPSRIGETRKRAAAATQSTANMSITGMNFSLMLNSVGFYQISKLSMIPVVCVMEWILHNKHYSREVKMSVVVVVIGVGVCTVTDVKVNLKGFICACLAVLSTSLQQISIGSLQKKYSIGSFELLSKTAPIQALFLLILGPFVDYYLSGKLITNYKISSGAILCIILSCSLAVFCNVSQYLCIGRFSAVSFQVLGHMKTVCVLTLGWLLFDSELTFKNIMGMIIAVLGMVIYSWAVEAEKQSNPKTLPHHAKNSMTEEEIRLLKDGLEKIPLKDVELGEPEG